MEIRPEIFRSVYESKKFKCNLQSSRQKNFQAANGIFGKIGLRAPHNLILSLIDTFCIPVLLYGVEAMPFIKTDRNALDFTYSTTFFKMFYVKEAATIRLCQFYSRCLTSKLQIRRQKTKFSKWSEKLYRLNPISVVSHPWY